MLVSFTDKEDQAKALPKGAKEVILTYRK